MSAARKLKKRSLEMSPYYRPKTFSEEFIFFFTRRFAWAFTGLLFLGAIIPLTLKLIANLFIGFHFKAALKNFLAIIAAPFAAAFSFLGVIWPTSSWVSQAVFPAPNFFKNTILYIKNYLKAHKGQIPNLQIRELQDENNLVLLKQNSSTEEREEENLWPNPDPAGKGVAYYTAPKRKFYKATNRYQHLIDSVEVTTNDESKSATNQHRIFFNTNGGSYQLTYDRSKEFKGTTWFFNYPGITSYKNKPVLKDKKWGWLEHRRPLSVNELVDAGIAQVYTFINDVLLKEARLRDPEKKVRLRHFTPEKRKELIQTFHLYGHSLGGGVALQVAAYFKVLFNIDIRVFVDRSFSSVSDVGAAHAKLWTGLPLSYSKLLVKSALYAAEWELDSVSAYQQLDSRYVQFVNLANAPIEEKKSLWQRFKNYFGLGLPLPPADPIIPEEASFMHAVSAKGKGSSHSIMTTLKEPDDIANNHKLHATNDWEDPHNSGLGRLSYGVPPTSNTSLSIFPAVAAYQQWTTRIIPEEKSSPKLV